jgi:hypothetical protein
MDSSKARGEKEPEAYPLQRTECDTIPANIDIAPALVFSLRTVKLALQLGRRRVTTGGVPFGYVEDCGETRTTLEVSFTARLAEEGHYGKTHQQIIDRMGENAG